MTSATVDRSNNKLSADNDKLLLDINSSDKVNVESDRTDLHYYYTSGNFQFILEYGFKPETLETSELTKVPFLPEWYEGIISIHGSIMPVIDILRFAKSQNINVVANNSNNRKYLLKLEHADHQPMVIKLDSIPQIININQLKEVNVDKDSPEWIKNYLENDKVKLALIDHNKLFHQLINQQ